MALEYEDIDLGQVSEVTKEEFDLAKLEAEGWVTELVISGHDADQFGAYVTFDDEEYDPRKEPIIAIKVNNQLVEHIREDNEEFAEYNYDLFIDLPIGTSIKIYHNPNLASKPAFYFGAYYYAEEDPNPYTEVCLEIYKCSKNLRDFMADIHVKCYNLSNDVQNIGFASCVDITARLPASVRRAEIYPAQVISDELDEYGVPIIKQVDLEVHLDGLPEEWLILGDSESYPDSHVKGYVPYHLLDEAKNKFPDYAEHIDALVPASKVGEESKLYRHVLDFDFVDNANLNQWVEDGEEPTQIYASVSFISNKKYLLDGDYGEAGRNAAWNIQGQEDNVITLNDSILNHLGNGMSAIIYLPGEILPASIYEYDKHCIVFALSDGRLFQMELTEDYDVPMSCTMIDFVSELK